MDEKIYEVKQTEEYVSYVLRDDMFSKLEYKVLTSQENGDFLPLYLLRQNGRPQFWYTIPSLYYSLEHKCAEMEPQILFHVIETLDRICTETEKNGFLKLEHLDLSLDRIFIETNSGKLQMIYLPLNTADGTTLLNKENIMRQLVKELLSHNINLKVSGRVQRLNRDLQNGIVTFTKIMENIRTGAYDVNADNAYFDDEGTFVVDSGKRRYPYLVLVENQIPIPITKADFLLGKNTEQVDGAIYNHNEVSRKHCRILSKLGKYYVKDVGSKNGTYLNQYMLRPYEEAEIHHGDCLRLGKCELIFYEG